MVTNRSCFYVLERRSFQVVQSSADVTGPGVSYLLWDDSFACLIINTHQHIHTLIE